MLKVYLDPCTVNCRKVLAGLDLMGAPFELVHVDYFAAEHKKPEFLAINPNGALPAATDDELALPESNAILQYAADLNGASQYYPQDLKKRADVNRWMLWEAATWFPSCYVYLVEYVVKPLLNAQPDESIIEKEAPAKASRCGRFARRSTAGTTTTRSARTSMATSPSSCAPRSAPSA